MEFAFGIPGAVGPASTGMPLRQARSYNTPLTGVVIGANQGSLPESFSLASPDGGPDDTAAIIAASKRGTADRNALILRLYQPTNAPLASALKLNNLIAQPFISCVTALEVPIPGTETGNLQLTLDRAIATVAVKSAN